MGVHGVKMTPIDEFMKQRGALGETVSAQPPQEAARGDPVKLNILFRKAVEDKLQYNKKAATISSLPCGLNKSLRGAHATYCTAFALGLLKDAGFFDGAKKIRTSSHNPNTAPAAIVTRGFGAPLSLVGDGVPGILDACRDPPLRDPFIANPVKYALSRM